MVRNCWYMWVEGSEPNKFSGCHMCYRFKIKDTIEGFDLVNLPASLNNPIFVSPKDNCDPPNGGKWEVLTEKQISDGKCSDDRTIKKSKVVNGKTQYCCRKDFKYECENKGGECSEDLISSKVEYPDWVCPIGQECYVDDDEYRVTYLSYVQSYGPLGGDIIIMDNIDNKDGTFEKVKIYSVSFVDQQHLDGIIDNLRFREAFKDLKVIRINEDGKNVNDLDFKKFVELDHNFLIISPFDAATKFQCSFE